MTRWDGQRRICAMWLVVIGLAVLFVCVGLWFWSRSRRPDQTYAAADAEYEREVSADQEAEAEYEREVRADQEADEEGR